MNVHMEICKCDDSLAIAAALWKRLHMDYEFYSSLTKWKLQSMAEAFQCAKRYITLEKDWKILKKSTDASVLWKESIAKVEKLKAIKPALELACLMQCGSQKRQTARRMVRLKSILPLNLILELGGDSEVPTW